VFARFSGQGRTVVSGVGSATLTVIHVPDHLCQTVWCELYMFIMTLLLVTAPVILTGQRWVVAYMKGHVIQTVLD
jgi:hypothetical protein